MRLFFIIFIFLVLPKTFIHAATKDGDVIKVAHNPDVFIVKILNGERFRRLILNPDVFNSYSHLKWESIKIVTPEEMNLYRISSLVRAEGDLRIWKLYPLGDTGAKRHVRSAGDFETMLCDWDAVYTINSFERDLYTAQSEFPDNCVYGDSRVSSSLNGMPVFSQEELGSGLIGEYFFNTNLSGAPFVTRIDPTINLIGSSNISFNSAPVSLFSIRWRGEIKPTCSGEYTFYTMSDDGIRVWIGDRQLINNWTDHSASENNDRINLTANIRYPIRVEYYANSGGASTVILSWSSTCGIDKAIVPSHVLFPVIAGSGITNQPTSPSSSQPSSSQPSFTNFLGEYWNLPSNSGSAPTIPLRTPDLTRTDQQINFLWEIGSPASGIIHDDDFAARWTKTEIFPEGNYTFSVISDDGVRLWVDSQLLINKWYDHSRSSFSANWLSPGGSHQIRIEYYENERHAVVQGVITKQ